MKSDSKCCNLYIGYDSEFGDAAFKVCAASAEKHSSIPLNIVRLDQQWLRRVGLYRRQFYKEDGQTFDSIDGKPFSTQFSFTRFLVPSLQPEGWAVFCDSDFLFRQDIASMVNLQNDRKAIMCVKHVYQPEPGKKMLGQKQEPYKRKNWSSLVMWNCAHPSSRMLTPYMVNTQPGWWLHQFKWMSDDEIGDIPENWNWLDGHSSEGLEPAAVHFTRGTPDMPGWQETKYAQEWISTWASL